MKSKLEQYNQAYKKAIGQILLKILPNTMPLTVRDVIIEPSFQHGKVWLSTTSEILHQVEQHRAEIQHQLKGRIRARYTPRLEFLMDDQYLDKLDNLFTEIKHED